MLPVQPPYTYASRIAAAARLRPDLLVIDRLSSENIPAALDAAHNGVCVLSQLDTVFRGTNVVRYLLDLGATPDRLPALTWVITCSGSRRSARTVNSRPRCSRIRSNGCAPGMAILMSMSREYPPSFSQGMRSLRPERALW